MRQQSGVNASLDARDLRLNARAQAVAVFFVKRINALVFDVLDELVMPACLLVTVYDGALFGRVRISPLRTQLCIFDGNGFAE